MLAAPLLPDEAERLADLASYRILDTPPEPAYDDIAALAAQLCGTPCALISLIDEDHQWFKSRVGLAVPQTHRDLTFCAHALLDPDEVMLVPDAWEDDRFYDNPLVCGDPGVRFYAGAPIVVASGRVLGTVCVIDLVPRDLGAGQIGGLRALARLVSNLLESRRQTIGWGVLPSVARPSSRTMPAGWSRPFEQEVTIDLLRSACDASRDLLSVIDTAYVYRHVNRAMLDYCGQTRSSIEGHPVSELIGADTFEQQVRPLLDRAMSGDLHGHAARFDFPQHGRCEMKIDYLPARNAAGRVVGVVVRSYEVPVRVESPHMPDCEERLQAVATALEDRSVARQRFLQVLAHDLREPLGAICRVLALLTDPATAPPLAEPGARRLEFVHRGCLGLQAVIDDLIGYLSLDGAEPQLVQIDVVHLLQEVCIELDPAIRRAGARVHWDEALPPLMAEPALLRVLLLQLIGNAIKFRRPGRLPEVRVSVRRLPGRCWIEVRDNGVGIAPARQAHLFDLFRGGRGRSGIEGLGMGLATCRRIVDLLGGEIGVESQPGQGSCFVVSLPQPVVSASTFADTSREPNRDVV